MSTRQRKRILQKVETQLGETVRGFLLSVPQGADQTKALGQYNKYNQHWKDYCSKMSNRHRWLTMDATAFEQRVTLINRQAERRLQPFTYYGKRIAPVVVIAVLLYIVTDYVLPHFGFTDYMLFN